VRPVLFDENMPRKLRRDLPTFFIRTAQEEGWSAFKNGALLTRAADKFDVFVTIDQRMRYQQNMTRFDIGVVVIEVPERDLFTCARWFHSSARPSPRSFLAKWIIVKPG